MAIPFPILDLRTLVSILPFSAVIATRLSRWSPVLSYETPFNFYRFERKTRISLLTIHPNTSSSQFYFEETLCTFTDTPTHMRIERRTQLAAAPARLYSYWMAFYQLPGFYDLRATLLALRLCSIRNVMSS